MFHKPIYSVNVQPDNDNSISVEAVKAEYLLKLKGTSTVLKKDNKLFYVNSYHTKINHTFIS